MFDTTTALVSADALAVVLGRADLKIFDVRGTWSTPARALPEAYDQGHLPRAVFLNWTKELLEPGVPVNLASVASREGARDSLRRLGIQPGDTVVLYDDRSHMFAGRIWWAMRAWGLTQVFVLNGGWSHWTMQGLPVSTERHTVSEEGDRRAGGAARPAGVPGGVPAGPRPGLGARWPRAEGLRWRPRGSADGTYPRRQPPGLQRPARPRHPPLPRACGPAAAIRPCGARGGAGRVTGPSPRRWVEHRGAVDKPVGVRDDGLG
ncbi:MAG: hypothetical protein KTR31_37750 [Myxococcales bacterium]|nr:hypothetical protein [Myxococcales bacterium]